jgi:hypothetical protein
LGDSEYGKTLKESMGSGFDAKAHEEAVAQKEEIILNTNAAEVGMKPDEFRVYTDEIKKNNEALAENDELAQ